MQFLPALGALGLLEFLWHPKLRPFARPPRASNLTAFRRLSLFNFDTLEEINTSSQNINSDHGKDRRIDGAMTRI